MAEKWTHVETSERTIHTGAGRLGGLIVSHDESTAQEITVYDGVSSADVNKVKLVGLKIAPEASPAPVYFEPPCSFSRGLVIVPGNCYVCVLSSGG